LESKSKFRLMFEGGTIYKARYLKELRDQLRMITEGYN